MDQARFDDLTKTLAHGVSRRDALKLLAGSAAGGLLALLGVREAAADDTCKPTGKKCRKDQQCCSGSCENGTCAPPLTQTVFACVCGDNTIPSTCNSTVCDHVTATAFCQEACASSFIDLAVCGSNAC